MSKKFTNNDLEKMSQSKHLCTLEADIIDKNTFKDDKQRRMKFELYDGIAYCEDFEGREYFSEFPKLEFVKKDCKEMAEAVMKYNNLSSEDDITSVHIMKTYGSLREIV